MSTLPDGLFVGLTSITDFAGGKLKLKVKLEKVADGEFKAVCPSGVPSFFSIHPHADIENGTFAPDETDGFFQGTNNYTIPDMWITRGTAESGIISVIRTDGTTDAVTVTLSDVRYSKDIRSHGYDYVVDPDSLPIEVIPAVPPGPSISIEIPDNTQLLSNYPNPFNPETWIPYQLSKSADVSLTIYNMRGVLVRKLSFGHQKAGFYKDRRQAAYWDGRNSSGEKVAAGIYFVTFNADDYTSTRKMLILK